MRVRPESMTAYERLLQALRLMDYMDKDIFRQAHDVLRQAMDDDPRYAMPVAWSVWWHIIWVGQGWSTDPTGDFVAANALAERAILLDPNNALGLAMMAHMRSYLLHDYDGALIYFARAIEAGPSNPIAVAMYSLDARLCRPRRGGCATREPRNSAFAPGSSDVPVPQHNGLGILFFRILS